jgi:hypothetical protein
MGAEMNRDQLRAFLASAPVRREAPEEIRQRLISAVLELPAGGITIQALAKAAGVNFTTVWHRVKHTWKLKPTGAVVGPKGHSLETYDRDEILRQLNAR